MSNLTYTDYEGWGTWARQAVGYRQAVQIKDQLHLSGQGGWLFDANKEGIPYSFPTDLESEIDQAFQNVNTALRAAGSTGWNQVYRLNSYHTDIDAATEIMTRCFKKYLGEHQVIWTEIGVRKLGAEGMNVELEVSAYLGE